MSRFRTISRTATRLAGTLACVALASACYRVTVVSNAAPSPTVVDKPWVNSFVLGLVPPSAPVDVAQQCPGGNVAKVVTERSFLNGLVAALTSSIYTPMHVQVTCAASRSSMGLPPDLLGQPVGSSLLRVAADSTK